MRLFWTMFLAIAKKEVIHATRNKASLLGVLTFQIAYLFLLGFIDMTAENMPTVVVDQDLSSESRELMQQLESTRTFRVKFFTTSIDQARDHLRAGRASVAVVIPPHYHRDRVAGGEVSILVLVDGTDAVASQQALGAIGGLAAHINIETQRRDAGVTGGTVLVPRSVLMFNPQGRNADFILPGLLAFIISVGFTIVIMFAIVRERVEGTLDRLLMTPMSPTGLILGKLSPYLVFGFFDTLLYTAAMRFGFGIPIRGSFILLVVLMLLYILTILSFGAFIGSGARSFEEANMPMNLVQIAATFLTGYIFPLSSLPKVLLPIAYLLPPTHMIAVLRGLCLRGAGVLDLLPHIVYLVLAPIILIALAVRRFNATTQV
jgi:ABC-2 type transport system permease protein